MRTLFGVRALEYEDISKYTSNFSEERFITKFQYGTVFRGRNGDQVLTVKVWNDDEDGQKGHGKLIEELWLLGEGNVKGHPKPIGFCDDKNHPFAVVYDLNPMNTVHNLIPNGNFSWLDRIKVALEFALTLRSFHAVRDPFKIRNISSAHIMCDQDCTPILYDFGMIAGGFFTDNRWRLDGRSGYYGYIDPYFIAKGECSTKTDVFAYGVVLLGLITKRVFSAGKEKESDFVNKWAEQEYDRNLKQGIRTPSLVDTSLKTHQHFDSGDGRRITQLAMRCIKYYPDQRHEMDDVVRMLRRLKVVRNHVDENDLTKKFERSDFNLTGVLHVVNQSFRTRRLFEQILALWPRLKRTGEVTVA